MGTQEHLTEAEMATYIDGWRLGRMESIPEKLLGHVRECEECKQAIADISATIPDETFAQPEAHPFYGTASAPSQPMGLIYRAAAGLVFLIGIGIVAYFVGSRWKSGHDQAQQIIVPHDSTIIRNERIADVSTTPAPTEDRFAPYPLLNRMANTNLRGAAARAGQPANHDTIPPDQIFTWEGGNSFEPYGLTILDNTGREVAEFSGRSSTFRLTKRLPAGRYYWKVEQQGELQFVREFFVRK
jgi:hypothetical protein